MLCSTFLSFVFWHLFIAPTVDCTFYKSNTTDLSKCQVYYSRSGSTYKDFFDITDEQDPSGNGSYVLDFHFAVLAPSDAHILLAASPDVEADDPAYEIVIGAGGNTFCDIRRRKKHDVKASVRVKNLLSSLDPQFFWLHITTDGAIEVGKEGEELAFISWIDPDVLPLKVFSFSTWPGIEAKWYFNCDRSHLAEEVEKHMTDLEKLRKDLLTGYDPYVRPVIDINSITTVVLTFFLTHVTLDEHRSIIDVRGTTKIEWHDEKLKWDPENYNGIESLHIFRREIWHPDLMLSNAVGDVRDILQDSMMVVDPSGNVVWTPSTSLSAWCDAGNKGLWPNGEHLCTLSLIVYRDFKDIQLDVHESTQLYPTELEWDILQILVTPVTDSTRGHELLLTIILKRNSKFYETVFFTPFLVIAVCQLSTFWLSPIGQMKISLGAFQFVLSALILVTLGIIVPTHCEEIPYLVYLYGYTFIGTLISIIISIIIINLVRIEKGSPPRWISLMLSSRVCSICFCLADLEVDNYGKLDTSIEKNQFLWTQIGIMIDRICFIIYLALIIYAILIAYL